MECGSFYRTFFSTERFSLREKFVLVVEDDFVRSMVQRCLGLSLRISLREKFVLVVDEIFCQIDGVALFGRIFSDFPSGNAVGKMINTRGNNIPLGMSH